MSGARRYWNEDAQRWEERGDHDTPPAAVTSPAASSVGPPDAARPGSKDAAPAPGAGRRLLWPVTAAVVAVGVVVSVVVAGDDGDGHVDRAGPSTSPTATRGDDPAGGEPSAAPSTPAFSPLPDGYKPVRTREGFSTAVPRASKRFRSKKSEGRFRVVYRTSVDKARYLTVFEVAEPTIRKSFEVAGRLQGFHRMTPFEPFRQGAATGKLIEFTVDDGETTWHGVEIRFRAADGELYGVTAQHADDGNVTKQRWIAATAARYFCPSGQRLRGRNGQPMRVPECSSGPEVE